MKRVLPCAMFSMACADEDEAVLGGMYSGMAIATSEWFVDEDKKDEHSGGVIGSMSVLRSLTRTRQSSRVEPRAGGRKRAKS